jgi:hypothetical protein
MRKIAIALGLLLTLAFTSCAAGPQYLRRSLDNYDQKLYQEMPLVDGILWFPIPAFPIANYIAMFGDFFVNGYAFWIKDVWAGEGTGFQHADLAGERKIKSLVRDDSEFLKFEGH